MLLNLPDQLPANASQFNMFTTHNFYEIVHLTNARLTHFYIDALKNREELMQDIHFKCLAGSQERDFNFDLITGVNHAKEIRDEWLDSFNYVAAEQLAFHFMK